MPKKVEVEKVKPKAKPKAIKRVSEEEVVVAPPAAVEPTKKEAKPRNPFKVVGKERQLQGSVLNPQNGGLHFVLSFTNTAGKGESPLYPLFDTRWRKVKEDARSWFVNKTGAYKLGAINHTAVQSDTWVIHLLCQKDDLKVDSDALRTALTATLKLAKAERASVHVASELVSFCPELPELLRDLFIEDGLNVYYYQ